MENNLIAYTIGTIFKHIIDYVKLCSTNIVLKIISGLSA